MKAYVFRGTIESQQPLATCSKDLNDREGGEGKPLPVPSITTKEGRRLYFPATGIRGRLRRSARDVVRQHLINKTGNPNPFSLDEHYLLTLGGIKSDNSIDRASVATEAYWRTHNPLLSIFGAGDAGVLSFVSGHLAVGNAICVDSVEEEVFSGARTDDLYRDRSQTQFLSDEDVKELVRRAQGNRNRSELDKAAKKARSDAKKAKKAGDIASEAAFNQQAEAWEREVDVVRQDSGTGAVSVGMPLAGWKAIPQGQLLDHRMHLLRSNPIELGLLIAALDQFSLEPLLGAHHAAGCGLVSGQWEVSETTDQGLKAMGVVRFSPFEGIEITGPILHEAVAAFRDFMDNGNPDFRIPSNGTIKHA